MDFLSIKVGNSEINAPAGVPTGGVDALQKILQVGLNLLFVIAMVLSLVYLIYGGLDWVRSEGDKQKVENAKRKIIYAVLGLGIVLFSLMIMRFINYIFGVNNPIV